MIKSFCTLSGERTNSGPIDAAANRMFECQNPVHWATAARPACMTCLAANTADFDLEAWRQAAYSCVTAVRIQTALTCTDNNDRQPTKGHSSSNVMPRLTNSHRFSVVSDCGLWCDVRCLAIRPVFHRANYVKYVICSIYCPRPSLDALDFLPITSCLRFFLTSHPHGAGFSRRGCLNQAAPPFSLFS